MSTRKPTRTVQGAPRESERALTQWLGQREDRHEEEGAGVRA